MTASGFGSAETQGMGLVSMRERAELVNGRLEFWTMRRAAARWCA